MDGDARGRPLGPRGGVPAAGRGTGRPGRQKFRRKFQPPCPPTVLIVSSEQGQTPFDVSDTDMFRFLEELKKKQNADEVMNRRQAKKRAETRASDAETPTKLKKVEVEITGADDSAPIKKNDENVGKCRVFTAFVLYTQKKNLLFSLMPTDY